MGSYQQHTLESASAVDLVVALYDGIIRFLNAAAAAVDRQESGGAASGIQTGAGHHHSSAGEVAHGCGRQAGAGAERVLRHHLCADIASLAIGFEAEIRARDRVRAQCARCLARGGEGSGGESGSSTALRFADARKHRLRGRLRGGIFVGFAVERLACIDETATGGCSSCVPYPATVSSSSSCCF